MTEFFWEIKGEGKGEFKEKGQLTTPSAPSEKGVASFTPFISPLRVDTVTVGLASARHRRVTFAFRISFK